MTVMVISSLRFIKHDFLEEVMCVFRGLAGIGLVKAGARVEIEGPVEI
jgi:hypothetical protein